jgi:hypothetical protein
MVKGMPKHPSLFYRLNGKCLLKVPRINQQKLDYGKKLPVTFNT